jgi:hypothetical protein
MWLSRLTVVAALCFVGGLANAQSRTTQAPAFLLDEIYRQSQNCLYYKDYRLFKQNKRRYVIAAFVNREAMTAEKRNVVLGPAASPCGSRLQQVRLYRLINDSTIVLKDSVLLDKDNIAIGYAADFDGSGTTKFIINHFCKPPEGTLAPLLCYSFSLYEISKAEKLRPLLVIGNVPEHYRRGIPQGTPLEPVVTDNIDKTPYPECLAVDDFFEGDPAFRPDDFPRITLLYTWDVKEKVYRHHSDLYPHRFALPVRLDSLSDNLSLTHFMEQVMSLAAIGKRNEALLLMELGLTPERIEHWKSKDPARAQHMEADRLRSALLACIGRYTVQR